ncbi:MAG: hypothetical protein K0S61_4765, partial [Anaerocolumna sp.]|nr:hypothetical protein [Anaerocolumna sp.]
TPVLPGITDVFAMISEIDENIPIYLDKLRFNSEDLPGKGVLSFIKNKYPELFDLYEDIWRSGIDKYYDELKSKLKNHPRVKSIFE